MCRDMTVLPGEWPSWSREFGTLAFSGTLSRSVLTVAAPLPFGSEISFSAQHLHCPQGKPGGLKGFSKRVNLPLTVDIVSSRTFISCSPKGPFCLCFFPSSNVPLQVLPSAVHTFHRFS